jgi:hypothetical protein
VIAQPAQALHLDLDHVPGLDRPGVGRRPGQQHVAGHQGDRPGDVGHQVVHVPAHLVGPRDKLEGYGYDPARAPILPIRLADALDALEADRELADVLGGYFVASFLAYKRNEIERFERFVTDWEFREYAYHL